MGRLISIEERDNIKILGFDNQKGPMNVLSRDVLEELEQIIDELQNQRDIAGVIFRSLKKDTFIAGADIKDIEAFSTADEATEGARAMEAVFRKISQLPFPTVAAIHGTCLGGGLELSLACTWRIGTRHAKTKLGLPEIQLGLLPGAGGTQRLPRLIGIQPALDMILTGKHVPAKKAQKLGLLDAVVPDHLLIDQAMRYALKPRSKKGSSFNAQSLFGKDLPAFITEGNALGRKFIRKKAREMVDDKTKGFYPASYKALDAVFEGFERTLEEGLLIESEYFGQLAATRESASLIHLFHATNEIKKHPYEGQEKEHFGEKSRVETLGVVGAGFMGAGVTTVAVDKGLRVRLCDPNKESLGRALDSSSTYFGKKLQRKRLQDFEVEQRMARISPGLSSQGLEHTDIVIEAVFEDLDLKKKILADFEAANKDDLIFASNTSALPIGDIAAEAKRPENVIGMHFFSPVEKMPLLEIVVTDKTADWVTDRTVNLGRKMGKQVIVVKDSPGFYTTRALAFFLAEAAQILKEGVAIETIDKALTNFGFPVGPITLIDEVGVDVGQHVLETMQKAFPERIEVPEGLQAVIDSGRLGRKNSKGFYKYQNGKKSGSDQQIYSLMGISLQAEASVETQDIVDRCLLLFVNESVRCLEEGILPSAYAGDVGAVFGLGFPPFWGGPFKYVDLVGVNSVVEHLRGLADKFGKRFEPCQLLLEMAEKGQSFFDQNAS